MANRYPSILDVIHSTAKDMRDAGAIDKVTMREFDALCIQTPPQYAAEDIRKIRTENSISQGVMAGLFNVSKSTIAQWEQGERKPSGASLRLLEIFANKGLKAFI